MRAWRTYAGVLLALLWCTRSADVLAAPADDRDACFEAAERSQLLTKAGKLRAARPHLLTCAREQCPSQMRKDCVRWLADVDASLASVVLEAKDARGTLLTDVRVEIDGEPLAERLDGRPIEIDPGEHTFTFVGDGAVRVEERVVIPAAERARRVSVVFGAREATSAPQAAPAPAPSPVATSSESSIPIVAYVIGGGAIALAGAGTYFAVSGLQREDELRSSCATRCDEDAVDGLRQRYLVADVLFGLAAVAAVATVWLVVTRPTKASARLAPNVRPLALGTWGSF